MDYNPFGIKNIKSLLKNDGLYLSKNRGQNYLINKQTAQKIIKTLEPLSTNQIYFEVGTGLGALTVLLTELGETISLEIDQGIYTLVSKNFHHPNLRHLHEDFLNWNDSCNTKEYIFISNLPYSISGEVIKIFIEQDQFSVGTLMLQKEFANRMLASVRNSNYGPLSVIAQNFLDIEKLFSVNKGNFFPEPKVDSLVIKIRKKRQPFDQKEFSSFIKKCFLAKRKTLLNNLEHTPWANSPIKDDPVCALRPDAITPEKWAELFQQIS